MRKVNILILDDRIENVISISALLSNLEHVNLLQTTNPHEALRICWKEDISIALVDVQMPDINGFEFVSLLKNNPKTNHIVSIMVTAISKEDHYLIKGLKSGAVDYLYKPLNPEITLAKVGSYIRQIHIQDEIIQKNNELKQSREALIKAKEEAEEARKSKEIFLANMSHEIRTPINGIMGIISMFKASELSREQEDWVKRLENASHSLLHILNDILDISKIDSNAMTLEEEVFQLSKLIEDIEKTMSIRVKNKPINFQVELDENTPSYIKADPLRLQQIIINYISNSLKFTEKGFIKLCTKVIEKKDNFYTIEFSIKDSGIGIAEESLENIFEAFQQADNSITKKYGGTGLGLAIVNRLAKLMDGQVDVKSKYGEGSEFSFTATFESIAPVDAQIAVEKGEEKELESFPNVKILIAEDNELNVFILVHMLKSWQCDVDTEKNGYDALQAFEKKNYDIILMDTHMPIMSGIEAIKKIRTHKDPKKRSTPIITVSASVLEHEQEAAKQAGADDVLSKPFHANDLHGKIQRLL